MFSRFLSFIQKTICVLFIVLTLTSFVATPKVRADNSIAGFANCTVPSDSSNGSTVSVGSVSVIGCLQTVTQFLFIIGIIVAGAYFAVTIIKSYTSGSSSAFKDAKETIQKLTIGIILIGGTSAILSLINSGTLNIDFLNGLSSLKASNDKAKQATETNTAGAGGGTTTGGTTTGGTTTGGTTTGGTTTGGTTTGGGQTKFKNLDSAKTTYSGGTSVTNPDGTKTITGATVTTTGGITQTNGSKTIELTGSASGTCTVTGDSSGNITSISDNCTGIKTTNPTSQVKVTNSSNNAVTTFTGNGISISPSGDIVSTSGVVSNYALNGTNILVNQITSAGQKDGVTTYTGASGTINSSNSSSLVSSTIKVYDTQSASNNTNTVVDVQARGSSVRFSPQAGGVTITNAVASFENTNLSTGTDSITVNGGGSVNVQSGIVSNNTNTSGSAYIQNTSRENKTITVGSYPVTYNNQTYKTGETFSIYANSNVNVTGAITTVNSETGQIIVSGGEAREVK